MSELITIIFGAAMMLGTIGYWVSFCLIPLMTTIMCADRFFILFLAFFKLIISSTILIPVLLLELLIASVIYTVIEGE